MFDIDALDRKVSALLAEDAPASVTYAALECRLAIERVCYARLQIAHEYISQKDLKGWHPRRRAGCAWFEHLRPRRVGCERCGRPD